MCRESDIENILDKRGVNRLCHITQIDKLFSIMYDKSGIWANDFLSKNEMYCNDLDRMDGRTDYISTSIEYPNTWYYMKKKYVNPYVTNWAVIFIDPSVCVSDKTLFCPINSAASSGAYIGNDIRYFECSFAQRVGFRKRSENMLTCCPTDDQAEVLIYKHIPVDYFTGIAFESEHTLNTMSRLFDKYDIKYSNLYVASELFSTDTSSMIRSGCRPLESLRIRSNDSVRSSKVA
jgi:hypothetical protein